MKQTLYIRELKGSSGYHVTDLPQEHAGAVKDEAVIVGVYELVGMRKVYARAEVVDLEYKSPKG